MRSESSWIDPESFRMHREPLRIDPEALQMHPEPLQMDPGSFRMRSEPFWIDPGSSGCVRNDPEGIQSHSGWIRSGSGCIESLSG
jgi:hypothetical protein